MAQDEYEGLKKELIKAKIKALKESTPEAPEPDTRFGSYIERDAEYTKEAIVNFLTHEDMKFKVTELKAPVVVESIKTPEQPVNVELETLLGEYGPILKTLKKIGQPLGLGSLIDSLEGEIEKAVIPLLEGGATLPGLDLGKDDSNNEQGGLEAVGYVYIGEDPDSQDTFNVEDENGQKEFTTVRLFRDDIEEIL
tara:strand:- start:408 stop:992 length:585 start_codon:yes stop_codon:yes gene_type:complete